MESILKASKEHRYTMLGRFQADCKRYLEEGNRNANKLWSLSEIKHIQDMKALYNSFSTEDKPQFITFEEILQYEKQMVGGINTSKIKALAKALDTQESDVISISSNVYEVGKYVYKVYNEIEVNNKFVNFCNDHLATFEPEFILEYVKKDLIDLYGKVVALDLIEDLCGLNRSRLLVPLIQDMTYFISEVRRVQGTSWLMNGYGKEWIVDIDETKYYVYFD